ncbi:dihydroorotate dehydrogenase electron transfer subunit [Rhodopirellula halodulae]|uniref:dihydroorotate dehydrogenase electron transfer subunit n=1 Tax=Rhodopirellula halodulae TaxID=2894198 RepID=UPI001E417512|nr:dihydroorotate dehydrogenase electron transfer subunit [Rhodopirellula sp. JC737]MCC9655443.1 dihydroorotate dehydrogenase electron transfer subunit [Rhodopirellula sp. JC737]
MSNLHAAYYADAMVRVDAPLIRNEAIAENTHLLRVAAPEIARTFRPGQFVMIRMTGVNAPLIGRAFAIYDVHAGADGQPESIDLVYLRKGALTLPLSEAPVGTMVTVWGPLGNGFDDRSCDRLIMAVGGIGQTPMLAAGRDAMQKGWAKNVELIYGARRASLLAGVDDFRASGFQVTTCTDDGSEGRAARVPDVLSDRLKEVRATSPDETVRVITCGPEIMMEKSAEVCQELGVDCQVSMETPMACGIGICFSCVAKVKQDDGEWDYKRTCVEGPIFDACKIVWD